MIVMKQINEPIHKCFINDRIKIGYTYTANSNCIYILIKSKNL